jgi:site-specific recombinase XerD
MFMVEQWINKIRILKSNNTAKTYSAALKSLFPSGEDLSEQYLINRISYWQQQNTSTNTIYLRLLVYKQYLLDITNKPPEYNSLLEICSKFKYETKIPAVAENTVMEDVLKIAGAKYRLILCLLYESALRVSEVVNIDLADIKEDYILIRHTKSNKDRIVPITKHIKQYLVDYVKIRKNTSPALLTTTHGRMSIKTIQGKIKILAEKVGHKELHPHSFRHGGLTNLLLNGVDVKTIQALAGHSSLNTTQRYLHIGSNNLIQKIKGVYE